jgi:hypothetical protein
MKLKTMRWSLENFSTKPLEREMERCKLDDDED